MIAWLRGMVLEKHPGEVILDVQGVGFRAFIPFSTYEKLPDPGQLFQLHIHTQVREDAFHLYGFASKEEKNLFRLLISVNGIGSKLALSALSSLPPESLISALARENVAALSRIPGVGKRIAQRMIVELKDRLGSLHTEGVSLAGSGPSHPYQPESIKESLLSALLNLGYKPNEAERAVQSIPTDTTDLATAIRLALRLLAK